MTSSLSVSPPSESRTIPGTARSRKRSAAAVSAPEMSVRRSSADIEDGATPRNESPKARTSMSNDCPNSGINSRVTRSRARSIRGVPPTSAIPMLRDASISIGTMVREAAPCTVRTGRMRNTTSNSNVAERSAMRIRRRSGATGARPYASHPRKTTAATMATRAPRGRGWAKVTLLLPSFRGRERLEVPGD